MKLNYPAKPHNAASWFIVGWRNRLTCQRLGRAFWGGKPGLADQYTIKAYMQALVAKGNVAVNRGRKLACLKSFFKWLLAEGLVKSERDVDLDGRADEAKVKGKDF